MSEAWPLDAEHFETQPLKVRATPMTIANTISKHLLISAFVLGAGMSSSAWAQSTSAADAKAQYKADMQKCETMKGNDQDVCEKAAEARRDSAKADQKANKESAEAQHDAAKTKRDSAYDVAKEKCDAMSGDAKDQCIAQAKTQHGK
ncbi:hypothetical protein [Pollutimonas subterranea]